MVRPVVWRPTAEPIAAELAVIKAVRRSRLFVFLRLHRHELFDEPFQAELAQAYVDEVIEAAVMDRRWQLVLDCMNAEDPPVSKGTLVGFRKRLIERDLDRRLVERTVELAAATGGFGARALRAALDSSPLWGAGRVEDTFNLMGLRPAQGPGRDRGAAGAGAGQQGPPRWRPRPGCRSWRPPA